MANHRLSEQLRDRLDRGTPGYQQAWQALRALVDQVQDSIAGSGVELVIEMGHPTDLGQQFNVVTLIPKLGFRDVLFRAYLPPMTGWPVTLDLLEPQYTECGTEEQLQDRVSRFVLSDDIVNRLRMLREMGSAA